MSQVFVFIILCIVFRLSSMWNICVQTTFSHWNEKKISRYSHWKTPSIAPEFSTQLKIKMSVEICHCKRHSSTQVIMFRKIFKAFVKVFHYKYMFYVFICVNVFGKERGRVKKVLKFWSDSEFNCTLIKVMCIL